MMKVTLQVPAKKKWNLAERAVVRDAVRFCIDHYKLKGKLLVKLRDGKPDLGWAVNLSDNTYMVVINHQKKFNRVLEVVFHEMTHVKQYVRKELDLEFAFSTEQLITMRAIWKGDNHDIDPENNEHYVNSPWEIEAQDAVKPLFKLYKKSLRAKKS